MRRWTLLSLVGCSLVVYGANRLLTGPSGLNAVYFNGPDWQEAAGATLAVVDRVPSTALLKERRPDYERRPFSVEWRGFLAVPARGTYTFSTVSDDGSWVYVRGREVVANGGVHGPIEARGSITLDAGVHSIFVRYFQDTQDCVFQLSWSRDGAAFEPVPAWALFTERVPYGRAAAARITRAALAVLGVAWYLVVAGTIVRWVFGAARRLLDVGRDGMTPAFAGVMAVSVLLNVCGIWWAMPNMRGWAPDEVVPSDVLAAAHTWFANGWHEKYPPLHYAVLAAADSPLLMLSWLGLVDVHATAPNVVLVLVGRVVSVAMGAATIAVIYRCGLQLYGARGAAFAALTAALTLPFAYHSKLANVDVPYLLWYAVSLLAYIRILKRHDRRDYVLFAVTAALAGCTKDQAWAAYSFTPIAILFARWRVTRQRGGSAADVVFDRTIAAAVAAGAVTFLIAENVVFNFSGFLAHARTLLAAPAAWQAFPGTVAGQFEMAWHALLEMRFMFGWPLAVVAAVALIRAAGGTGTTPSLHWLLVPALSYYVVFIGGILYYYDRFLLPLTIVLSLYVGWWLEQFTAGSRRPAKAGRHAETGRRVEAGRYITAAVFAYSVLYVASVDYAMIFDSRYAVARWLHDRVRGGDVVGSLGPLEYQTIADGFAWASVESVDDVARVQPAFVVLNADQMAFLPPRIQDMHNALRDGRSGYRLAEIFRTRPLPLPGLHPDLGDAPRHGREFSHLSTINPRMEIFERVGPR